MSKENRVMTNDRPDEASQLYSTAPQRDDYGADIKENLPEAEQGDAVAQFHVGLFLTFPGEQQDCTAALGWLQKSAEQGYGQAQTLLGNLYGGIVPGLGALENPREAVRWWDKAAELQEAPALFNLGRAYAYGQGVPPDRSRAYQYFGLAVTAYQDLIDEGLPVQRHKKDARKARRRVAWAPKLDRLVPFFLFLSTGNRVLSKLLGAAQEANVTKLKAALNGGADVDGRGRGGDTALMVASSRGHLETIKALLAAGADVNAMHKEGGTALMFASQDGRSEAVELLLSAGADPGIKTESGHTALMGAAARNHVDAVCLLLAKGARVDEEWMEGDTALMLASNEGHTNTAKVLLAADADINTTNRLGRTAVMLAALGGFSATLKMLLEAGADVNISDANGGTALIMSAISGDAEAARLLLDAAAEIEARDIEGSSALVVALAQGNDEVARMLRTAIDERLR